MAKKGKDQQKQVASKHVTTRRLARWQREKRRQRITLLSGAVIIGIVVGIIIGGVITTHSSNWLSKVQTDSGTTTIKKAEYLDELKLFRAGIYNSSTMTNESPLLMIENNLLIKDGADSAGLTVSDTEVTDAIRSSFETENQSISDADFEQQYHDYIDRLGLSDKEFRDAVEIQMLGQKLLLYYVNQTPTSGKQAAVETIVVTNESYADTLTQMWRNGGDFTTLSAEYGAYNQSGWVAIDALDESLRNITSTIEIGNVSDPITIGNISDATSTVYYYIIKVLERKDDVMPDSLRQELGYQNFNTWFEQVYKTRVERNPDLDLAEIYAWAIKELS